MTRSVPAKLSVQSAHSVRASAARTGLHILSNSKGSRSAKPNGTPGRFSSLITRLQSSQITGVQCHSAHYEFSGIGPYVNEQNIAYWVR